MELPHTRPRRLGMLIPSSNTVLEPETAKLLPADGSITTHASRIRVVTISPEADSSQQFETHRFVTAATLLMDAQVDLILWNGTAASWLGFDVDRQIVDAVEHHTAIRATTAVMAINATLAACGAKRIGLVTPYVKALEDLITANYAGIGIDVASTARLDLTVNREFAEVSPERIAAMVRNVAASKPDAVVIMCTNLAGASVSDALGRELGLPVIDSVRVAIDYSCRLLTAE